MILQEGAHIGIQQPFLHNPRDQAIDSLLPPIPIKGVLAATEEGKTLVPMHLTLMGKGEAGGVIPRWEEHQDSASQKRDSRRRDTEVLKGVRDRGLLLPVK